MSTATLERPRRAGDVPYSTLPGEAANVPACILRGDLWDTDRGGVHADDIRYAASECRACPILDACTEDLRTRTPAERPAGMVMAGYVVTSRKLVITVERFLRSNNNRIPGFRRREPTVRATSDVADKVRAIAPTAVAEYRAGGRSIKALAAAHGINFATFRRYAFPPPGSAEWVDLATARSAAKAACGTFNGYTRHVQRGEAICGRCRDAYHAQDIVSAVEPIRDEILRRYLAGDTVGELAAFAGVSKPMLYRYHLIPTGRSEAEVQHQQTHAAALRHRIAARRVVRGALVGIPEPARS